MCRHSVPTRDKWTLHGGDCAAATSCGGTRRTSTIANGKVFPTLYLSFCVGSPRDAGHGDGDYLEGSSFRTLWPVVLMNATLSFHSDSPQDEILWFPWTSAAARQTGFATFSKSSISHYSPIASLRLPSSVGRCHESPSHQRWSSLS